MVSKGPVLFMHFPLLLFYWFSPLFHAGRGSTLHEEAGAATARASGTDSAKSPRSSRSQ